MFGKKNDHKRAAPRRGAAGKRAYAIGDVHGCHDALQRLLALIKEDQRARAPRPTFLVFLGDLIDRGPASRAVVDDLLNRPPDFARCVFIKGNHEDSLVRALGGEPALLKPWLEHGGYACAASYGVPAHYLSGQSQDAIEHALLSAIPRSHTEFLDGFVDSVVFGDYLLAHAGVRPGVALEAQSPADLRWIRHTFLDSDEDFGKIIVHGHTVSEHVDIRNNRIGLDTGAYLGGALSCLRIEDEEIEILQAR